MGSMDKAEFSLPRAGYTRINSAGVPGKFTGSISKEHDQKIMRAQVRNYRKWNAQTWFRRASTLHYAFQLVPQNWLIVLNGSNGCPFSNAFVPLIPMERST